MKDKIVDNEGLKRELEDAYEREQAIINGTANGLIGTPTFTVTSSGRVTDLHYEGKDYILKSKIEELVKKMEIAKKDYQDHSSGSSVFGIRASEVQIAINQLTELIK